MPSLIFCGDARDLLPTLPSKSVQCCITSPPYWGLRDYGVNAQIGLEGSPSAYIAALMPIFDQVWRVLRDDGTLWLNLGDTYIGYHGNATTGDSSPSPSDKPGYRENMRATSVGADGLGNKNLVGIPWRVAFALQARGWILRSDIIWHKPNSKPESVKDRPTKTHEYIFLLSKSATYFYDHKAIREKIHCNDPRRPRNDTPRAMRGAPDRPPNASCKAAPAKHGTMGTPANGLRNKRSVWSIPSRHHAGTHFATFPPDLIRPCVLAGAPVGGFVLDPFFGSGTVGQVCVEEGRNYIGIELNPEYAAMAERRISEARPHGPRQASLLEVS